jgi:hypothetical protein
LTAEPYERLADLAEAELAACQADRHEDLEALYDEAGKIVAVLPPRPPATAADALQRAAVAQRQIGELLASKLVMADTDFERLRRGREAAKAYASSAHARAGL